MVFRDVDKKALIDNAAKILSKITIIEDGIVFTEDDSIVDWTYEDFRYVPENGFIGHFVERLLDGNLQDVPKEVILENKEINVQIGIVNGTTNETTFYDYGNFIVTTAERDDVSGSISFESADYTKKFNIEYVNNVTYPCLPADILVDACTQVGIDFDSYGDTYYYIPGDNETLPAGKYAIKINNNFYEFTTRAVTKDLSCITVVVEDGLAPVVTHKIVDTENLTVTREVLSYTKVSSSTASVLNVKNTKYLKLVNNDFVIRNNQFDSSDTCRDAVKAVAKLGFTWARIGTDNKLHLDFAQKDKSSVSEYNVITTDDYYNEQNQQELYGPVNCVSLGYSQVEGDDISRVVSSYTEGDKLYEIKVDDNPLWYTDELKVIALHDCDRLFGIEYAVFSTETVGHPWLEGDDLVRLDNLTGDTLYTYPFDRSITYSGFIKGVISSTANSYVQDQLNYDGDVAKNIRKTLFLVDKANQRVEILAQTVEGYDEKIAKIELDNQNISLTVTNVEKGLTNTNNTVSSLQKDVDSVEGSLAGIQDEIDGVSADFEDFKDNEYLQSIDNLQKQIDGAIQFWNGPTIPTLNNYPANQWTTENDRINHQADIYTVIEDVDGELKQGKGYRFDKVNGVWQWIELTDNELSAVQALADEALKKANANAGEITALKKTTTDLSVRDGEITASVNELNTKFETEVVIAKEASGNPIIVEDAGPYPLQSIHIDGKSYQETTQGYNVYDGTPSVSGYNTGITVTRGDNNNYINIKVTSVSGTNRGFYINIKPYVTNRGFVNGDNVLIKYKIKTTNKSNFSPYFGDWEAGSNKKYSQSTESTLTGDYHERYLLCTFNANAQYGGFIFYSADIAVDDVFEIKDFMICKSSTNKPYEPYTGGVPSPNVNYSMDIENSDIVINVLPLEDKEYSFNYTNNWETQYIKLPETFILKAGTYTLSYDIKSDNFSIFNKLHLTNTKNTYVVTHNPYRKISSSYETLVYTFTTTEDYEIKQIDLQNGDSGATEIDVKHIMIVEGYEPRYYVPTGNYLQQIVTGANLLYLRTVTGTKNGITYTWEGTKLTLNGTATASTDIYNFGWWGSKEKDPRKLLKAGTYTLSIQGADNTNRLSCNMYYDVSNVITRHYTGSKTTKTLTDDMYYSNCYVSIPNGSVFTNETFYFQLEPGDKVTSYSEYTENSALINLNKYNLKDNAVKIKCGIDETNNTIIAADNVSCLYVNVEPNTQYTIYKKAENTFRLVTTSEEPEVGVSYINTVANHNSNIITITTGDDVRYLVVTYFNNQNATLTDDEIYESIKIYEGFETDDYYRCANVGDTRDSFENGLLTQYIGKIVFDGSETWSPEITDSYTRFTYPVPYGLPTAVRNKIMSNYFQYVNSGHITSGAFVYMKKIYIYPPEGITTSDALKTWFASKYNAGKPVEFLYELENPVSHTIDYTQLYLHDGYNYIKTNGDIEPNMNITYLTNSKLNALYITKSELKVTTDSISTQVSSVTDLTTELGNDIVDINNSLSNYATGDRVDTLEQSVTTLQTDRNYTITAINDLKENGVSKVKTETGFVFDSEGLHIKNSKSPVGSTLDNRKLLIEDNTSSTPEELLYAGVDATSNEAVVRTKNLTVHQYFTIGSVSRFEPFEDNEYEDAVGVFEI